VSEQQPARPAADEIPDTLAHTVLLDHGVPARYLARRAADEWLAGGYNWLDASDDAFRWAALAELVARDQTLAPVLDLEIGWQAWRRTPDDPWERERMPVGKTYLFVYEARPTERLAEHGEIAGAWVNCWVKTRSQAWGRRMARRAIEEDGWEVVALDEESEPLREMLDEDVYQFYQEAQVKGLVLVYYHFQPEDDDDFD